MQLLQRIVRRKEVFFFYLIDTSSICLVSYFGSSLCFIWSKSLFRSYQAVCHHTLLAGSRTQEEEWEREPEGTVERERRRESASLANGQFSLLCRA